MNVKMIGEPLRVDRRELPQAVKFFMGYLVDKEVFNDLEVRLTARPHLQARDNHLALCICDSWFKNPRQFTIVYDPMLTRIKLLPVLAHECVHVKQWSNNELSVDTQQWMGKEVDAEMSYDDLSWEIEAKARENILFHRYEKERKTPTLTIEKKDRFSF